MGFHVKLPREQKFSFRLPVIGFLNIFVFVSPFMFLGKNYSTFSLILLIFLFIIMIVLKFIMLSSASNELNAKRDLIILAISLSVAGAIYGSFMHLGYNQSFFNIPLNLGLFLSFSIVCILVDVFWIIKWNRI